MQAVRRVIPSRLDRLAAIPQQDIQNKRNDYQRTETLSPYVGQTGILIGESSPFDNPRAQLEAVQQQERYGADHPRWNLQPAQFIPNSPQGYNRDTAVPLHHISLGYEFPIVESNSTFVPVLPRDPRAAQADWPVIDPTATRQPPLGNEIRQAVVIAERPNQPGKLSPTPFPGVFNDQLALQAINAALSGAPASSVRRRVQAAANQYDAMVEQNRMLYLADDAIARQLIARAGEVPLSSANASILAAAQQHLAAMPQAMPNPYF